MTNNLARLYVLFQNSCLLGFTAIEVGKLYFEKTWRRGIRKRRDIHLQESVSARLSQEKSLEVCGVLENNLKFFSSLFIESLVADAPNLSLIRAQVYKENSMLFLKKTNLSFQLSLSSLPFLPHPHPCRFPMSHLMFTRKKLAKCPRLKCLA